MYKLIEDIMKLFSSLVLFFAFLLKMGGFYAILSIERHEIREKVEQKIIKSLKKSELICIVANSENSSKITWERPQKEFRFEGNLYDVAFVEVELGITYYYCLNDTDETKLTLKIDKLLENQTEHLPSGDSAKLILHLLSEPLITYHYPVFYFTFFSKKTTSIFPNLSIFYRLNFLPTLKNPPEIS